MGVGRDCGHVVPVRIPVQVAQVVVGGDDDDDGGGGGGGGGGGAAGARDTDPSSRLHFHSLGLIFS